MIEVCLRLSQYCSAEYVTILQGSLFFFFLSSSFDFATLQVHLFVCNTDEDIRAAFEAGATGVMSDYPSLLSYYLLRNTREECELLTSEVHNTS